jgi:inner membrane protein
MTDISNGAPARTPMTRSAGPKFLLVIGLSVAMAVPLFFIQLALSDRQGTANNAAAEIATGWGGPQTVAGPMLVVPYTVTEARTGPNGATVSVLRRDARMLLPEALGMTVHADTETRKRGIFSVPVYRSRIDIHARFDKAALQALMPDGAAPLWNQSTLSISVSDAQGLADNVTMTENGQVLAFQPGFGPNFIQRVNDDMGKPLNAIHVPLALDGPRDIVIDTQLLLRGSREINLVPLGRRTVAAIDSAWAHPSFSGGFLPSSRSVGDTGFKATWLVPYLARGFGQSFAAPDGAVPVFLKSSFGVRFYQPVDYYQLVGRSLKYAILFVALAFLTFFVAETISLQRLHAVQYTLVGAAQVLFYLLLLSLIEHVGFAFAYLIAAAATIALTGLYAAAAFRNTVRAAILATVLAALYALLYVILNAEDYALLIGAGVLFAALAATMYVTRRIDWYRLAQGE